MTEPGAIFISYRRSDAGGYAWALRDHLTLRFDPDTLFFDREKIDAGTVFPNRLRAAIEGCQVLLAVIGPDWLDAADGNGRRLDDEHDWVRREIAMALALGKRVVPVLFGDDTQPPPADQLPEPLRPLASLQVKRLRGDFREYDAQRQDLVRLLAQVPGVPAPRADHTQPVIGIPPEQVASLIVAANEPLAKLTAQQQQTIRALEQKTGVSEGALRTFFRTLGEANVPSERYAEKLGEIAERYRTLVAEIAAMPAEEPEIARLKDAADAALQAGDLDQASALHVEMLALQDQVANRAWQEAERKRLEAAATAARLGEIALTGLRYLDAARRFAAAASRVPPGHEEDRLHYLDAEASALFCQGDEKGDTDALRTAIERYQALIGLRLRDRVPLDWAMTQNNLGVALWRLGERENGTEQLEEAVTAVRAALKEFSREREPQQWAKAQTNLAGALVELGRRNSDTAQLRDAVTAIRSALEVTTRDQAPIDWAGNQNNLGFALWWLGEQENDFTRLEEAVVAYRAALEQLSRDRTPLQWATIQTNLGLLLWRLGEHEHGDTALLKDGVAAFQSALEVRARDRVPLLWASTQNSLGLALWSLGARTANAAILRKSRHSIDSAFAVMMQAGLEQHRKWFEDRLRELDEKIAALANSKP